MATAPPDTDTDAQPPDDTNSDDQGSPDTDDQSDDPADPDTDQPDDQSADEPDDQPADQPTDDQQTDGDQPADQPDDQSDQPSDDPADQPDTDEPDQPSDDQPTDQPDQPGADEPDQPPTAALFGAVTLTVTPTTGTYGNVTFTATVNGSGDPEGLDPTGNVSFTTTPDVGSCPTAALSPGTAGDDIATATCQVTVGRGQSITVNVSYAGDGTYSANTASITYQAAKELPTVTVAPSGTGAPGDLTFTATVDGTGPNAPSGTVDFSVEGPATTAAETICDDVPVSGDPDATAECAITVDPGASITVTASYSGDDEYEAATGSAPYQARWVATVSVSSPDADDNGQLEVLAGETTVDADFVATLDGGGGPQPMGTVAFTVSAGTPVSCGAVSLPSTGAATATCQVTGIPADTEVTVTAAYTPSGPYEPGASGEATFRTPTKTVTVTISAPPNAGAGEVPFTATVTSSDGSTPTGTVTISLTPTSGVLGVGALASGTSCDATLTPGPGAGQASGTCTLTVPAGATVAVSATYNGSAANLAATSSAISFQGKRTAAVSLAVNPASPVEVGTLVTLTATVAADSSGIVPTGTVRFDAGGTAIAGCEAVAVSAGTATCTTAALPTGSLTLNATYSGDAEYLAGSAQAAGYQVNAAVAATTALSATGADVGGLLLGALLLLLVGGGAVAFGHTAPGRRGTR